MQSLAFGKEAFKNPDGLVAFAGVLELMRQIDLTGRLVARFLVQSYRAARCCPRFLAPAESNEGDAPKTPCHCIFIVRLKDAAKVLFGPTEVVLLQAAVAELDQAVGFVTAQIEGALETGGGFRGSLLHIQCDTQPEMRSRFRHVLGNRPAHPSLALRGGGAMQQRPSHPHQQLHADGSCASRVKVSAKRLAEAPLIEQYVRLGDRRDRTPGFLVSASDTRKALL